MNKEVAEKLVEVGQDEGLETELREDYSGRGMFGDKTAAVCTATLGDIILCFTLCGIDMEPDSLLLDELTNAARRLRWDSMGRGVVVY